MLRAGEWRSWDPTPSPPELHSLLSGMQLHRSIWSRGAPGYCCWVDVKASRTGARTTGVPKTTLPSAKEPVV